eukprot:TRINITY_DN29100_c0_g2_i1.p1 TRINITY_DN29100_c0_g2~~TRINITY_DN29100_c0_g2_i1.p1  ORF type:complete len:333 (+),score=96.12 TRINITY_DN29100_c0_g2_i1:40-999(+)
MRDAGAARQLKHGTSFRLPLRRDAVEAAGDPDFDWSAQAPRAHHPAVLQLPEAEQRRERERGGQQLLRSRSFRAPCAKDELSLHVALETPEEARRLLPQAERLESDMHDLQVILLDQFIDKDYGDDLLLLTASEEASGRLVGMIFWRYLHKIDDDMWEHVRIDWEQASPSGSFAGGFADAWTYIELICTDEAYRGHGIGKLLLTAALAYSTVKDGKQECLLVVGHGDDNEAAKHLYRKVGFEEMPRDVFTPEASSSRKGVRPEHVMVIWNIKRSLRSLRLKDVSGTAKGTRVPQMERGAAPMARLNSDTCVELVDQLTT